jgi:hypothetical protein
MEGGIVASDIGSISGTIDVDSFLAIELTIERRKVITNIDCGFRLPAGKTKTTQPFLLGRLIVVKKAIKELDLSNDAFQAIDNKGLLFDKTFYNYDGLSMTCRFDVGPSEILSVILFPAYFEADLSAPSSCFGTLSIEGETRTDSKVKLRAM